MNRSTLVLTTLLVLSSVGHLWQARTSHVLRGQLEALLASSDARDARVQALAERARAAQGDARADHPERLHGPGAAPGFSARGAERPVGARAASVAGAPAGAGPGVERLTAEERREEKRQILLNGVLEVVADAAAEYGWDPEVAADVAWIYEARADRIAELRAEVKDGATAPQDARQEVLDLRAEAGEQLEEVLGTEDALLLKDQLFDRVQQALEQRRVRRE